MVNRWNRYLRRGTLKVLDYSGIPVDSESDIVKRLAIAYFNLRFMAYNRRFDRAISTI